MPETGHQNEETDESKKPSGWVEWVKEHPAIVGTSIYVYVSILGSTYNWLLLRAFEINYFDFSEANDFLTAAFFLAGVERLAGTFLAGLFLAGFVVNDAILTFLSVVSVYVHVAIGLPTPKAPTKMAARLMLQIFHYNSPVAADNSSKFSSPAPRQHG